MRRRVNRTNFDLMGKKKAKNYPYFMNMGNDDAYI